MSYTGEGARWLRIRRSIVMPEHLVERRGYAAQVATDVLHACHITRPPIDLDDIVNYLGNHTVINSFGLRSPARGIEAHLMAPGPGRRLPDARLDASAYPHTVRVEVHQRLSPPEKRLAFAHGLGHLLLHTHVETKQLMFNCAIGDRSVKDQQELEAIRFADNLLLPIWLIEQEWRSGKDVGLMAEAFQTTISAIVHRLRIVRHE